jgi:hypothetical protein
VGEEGGLDEGEWGEEVEEVEGGSLSLGILDWRDGLWGAGEVMGR